MKKKVLFCVALLGSMVPFKVKAATEGINIDCGSDNAMLTSSSLTCKITGTTQSAVSGLQFRLTSNDLATISNIQISSIWQGDGDDGNIGIYTDTNKTGTFDIATFTLIAKNTGGVAHIYANDILFSDASFNIHSYGNKTKDVVIQATPSNTAFKDFNFYKCVINAYNGSTYPGVPYTTNLTDAQLKTIKNLQCNGDAVHSENKIIDTSGIEKLTEVQNINLSNHKITHINVSKNNMLGYLNLSNNQLANITFGTNNSLRVLNVNDNNLQKLEVSSLRNLESLYALGNPMTNLNILENSRLSTLEVNNSIKVPLTRVKSTTYTVDSNNIIRNVALNTPVGTIIDIFYSKNENYNYRFVTPQGAVVAEKDGNMYINNNDEKITTGTTYKIMFGKYAEEYTIMVKGDITGTGEVGISDIARLYQFYKKKVPMDQVYALAGDIDNDGKVQVNDIAKLYQFYKHKIDSLN